MADMSDVDMTGVTTAQDFPVMPDDDYTLFLAKSEKKATKAGDGAYLNCEFQVVGGPMDGRKVFHIFNIWNKNEMAVNIAKGEWMALCQAIKGVPSVKDSSELHDKKFIGAIKIGKGQDDKPRNELICREGKVRSANAANIAAQEKKSTPW